VKPRTITLVVPPSSGGVRDYADIIASGLREMGHTAGVFAWRKEDIGAIDQQITLSDCIYVQYSGYGYAKRGAPLWMISALRRRRPRIKRLGVFFHELYASGPPWSSAFWLSPVQQQVAAELVKMADFWLTSREHAAQWLSPHSRGVPSAVLPVFSNVGELQAPCRKRRNKVVVFGGSSRREKTYAALNSKLFRWAEQNKLEIHDAGPALKNAALSAQLRDNNVTVHGKLEKEALTKLLSNSMFGVLAYPVEFAAKSGVFAAYAAHGLATILATSSQARSDGLTSHIEYLPAIDLDNSALLAANATGAAALSWYKQHSIDVQVRQLFQLAFP
jgi:hypothetical protein